MRKFIIVGKTSGAVMLYDTEFGGMAVATYYTVRQLMSMGATIIGVKSNTKQFSCYVMDKNENRAFHGGVPVTGTKRSAVTFMKGIKKPIEERKAEKEAEKKAVLAEKERKRAEREAKKRASIENKKRKLARAEANKKRKETEKVLKKNEVSFHDSKCLCVLKHIENVSSEYSEKETQYYTLYARTKSAVTNMIKVLQNFGNFPAHQLGYIIKKIREGFNYNHRVSCEVPLIPLENDSYYQCVAGDVVTMEATNHYEDYTGEWKFRKSNGYLPEQNGGRHYGRDDSSYGMTSGTSEVSDMTKWLLGFKTLRNMPNITNCVYRSMW